ncbi:RHS repeat-associated core domain-containing protein [Bradyrhizobium sp. Pha-3]|uniref:RHS repeat-associated core domain-containing protein n=1 Tax=Bradyrhizobium sp. Pha-3 TaxID=208375 RepID=UPI0035D457CF
MKPIVASRSFRVLLNVLAIVFVFAGTICGGPSRAQTSPAPAEIVELARALKNDPDLIYEYVYNNIQTLPQYGSLKGPLGTLLDGKGTAFDQAELMVALLQQAGIAASFQIGQIQLSASQFTNWVGADTSVNSINFIVGSGGFPGNGAVGNPATAVQLGWAWVQVNIGGTNYVFDPSTKIYNRSAGLGTSALSAAFGYAQGGPNGFITQAENDATITPTSIVGLNRTNIRNNLATYASNLVQYIRANNPAAATPDIIGGATIVPLTVGTHLRQTSLGYSIGTVVTQPTIASAYRTTLTLTLGSNDSSGNFTPLASAITFNSSDIYDHRLVISFNGSSIPSLLFDGVTQVTASGAVPSGRQLTVRSTIIHPYSDPNGFANVLNSDAVRMSPIPNYIYLIGTGWGQVGRGTIEKHRKLLQANAAANPGNPSAESVLGESLAMIGYTWLAECGQQQQLVDQLIGTSTVYQHAVGVVGTKAVGSSSGPYVDLPINGFSIIQRAGRSASSSLTSIESAAFFSEQLFGSVAESGSLEQTQPGAIAASTTKLIDTTVQAGGLIFDINNSAISGDGPAYYTSNIRPTLVANHYTAGDLARVDTLVGSQNFRVVAPANGAISVNMYTGTGYYQVAQDGSSIGSIITGGLSGGEPTTVVTDPEIVDNNQQSVLPALTQSPVITNPQGSQGNGGGNVGQTQTTSEPINLVTGDYLNSPTDLVIGSQAMPYGLAFQRYYDSGTRLQKGAMGNGWTHNFAITATVDSDGFAGMAANSPISGASAIAATFVTLDILNGGTTTPKPLDRVVITAVIQRWMMDQLTNNIVAVSQPGYVEHFTKLADGSYNPPPGTATTLTLSGGTYNYLTKNRQQLAFDSAGNLKTLSNPAGTTITLNYSGSPQVLTSVTNNLGRSLSFTYSSGLLSQVSDGNGRVVSYGYDAASNLSTYTDVLGQRTNYIYDLPGRLTQIFDPASPGQAIVMNTYDSLGRIQTQASANNPPWQYFFAGTRSEEVDPFGTRHVIYTNPLGKTITEIQDLQGLNLVTQNTYDGLQRPVSTTSPEGKSSSVTYDANSNVLTTTVTPKPGSPLAPLVTTYSYDPVFNKPIRTVDPLGLVSTASYDQTTGNLTVSTADVGAPPHFNLASSFTYNSLGQVLSATDPLGVVTQYGYDGVGNRTSIVRDAGGSGHLNQSSTVAYNAVGDAISVTDPNGNTTTSRFDTARRPISTQLPLPSGLLTTSSYDPDGRPTKVQQSANGLTLRLTMATYTATGKLASTTDANGNTTSISYDRLDRVASVRDPLGRLTIYGYDSLSRQTAALNRAIQSTPLLQQAYTADGLIAIVTDASNHALAFAYDGFDRLGTTTYPDASTEVLAYDADGNVKTRQTRAGQTITFAYDTLNRLTSKTPPSPAAVVSYQYDRAGRVTGVSDTSASVTPPVSGSVAAMTYSYDGVNRLTATSFSPVQAQAPPSANTASFAFAYNASNQRIGQAATDNSFWAYPTATPSTVSYAANNLNQYTAVGAVTPSYDGNGNLTYDGSFTYCYDAENRLVAAINGGTCASPTATVATYSYDAQGQRKSKTVSGSTTITVTDPFNRALLDYDGSSGAILRWYAFGLGSNDVLNQTNVALGTRTTFIPDIQGSIVATLDSATGAFAKTGYLPYGASPGSPTTFGYTAQRIDPETNGLYYYRARHYSPLLGRFMQPDPVGVQGGVNLYAYVNNDPLNAIDPNGLFMAAVTSYLNQTTAPELAQSQAVTDFVQQYPTAAKIEGTIGLGVPLAIAGIGGLGVLGAETAGPQATLALARQVANAATAPMNNLRTIAVLETVEGPTLVAGGTTELSAAQVGLANELGLTVVESAGRHAEMAAISAAGRLGLTPTVGVTTNIICPQCAVAFYNLGARLTGARSFTFGP